MGMSRYDKRFSFYNRDLNYVLSNIFRKRGLTGPIQYTTARLRYPTVSEIRNLTIEKKIWTAGEKYFKLANEFYGDPQYWWVVAWYNQEPLETNVKPGTVIDIPTPIEVILQYLGIV
jgi:hypothetical protein